MVILVSLHGCHPPLNPVIENTICTPRIDADSDESSELMHKTTVVTGVIQIIHSKTVEHE